MTFKAGDEYALKLSKLADSSDEIAKKAIYSAAEIVADEIKQNLVGNLRDPAYAGLGNYGKSKAGAWGGKSSKPTGDLEESFGITPISQDEDGNWNVKIGFDGYDRKGVPNQLKARAMESGTSTLRKRPFVRPAVNATKKKAVEAMNEIIEEECKKIFDGR
jgi:HK97 gp10 family phage protein